jgi:hypothetical protein
MPNITSLDNVVYIDGEPSVACANAEIAKQLVFSMYCAEARRLQRQDWDVYLPLHGWAI